MDDKGGEWRVNWADQRRGVGCVLCGRSKIEDDEWGTRVFVGTAVDGFVWKTGVIPGYVVAVWKGRHVAEPTELEAYEIAAYWREVMMIGRAIESAFTSAKMNYETLGNNVPHLHTHIIPRPWLGDPDPNGHLGDEFLDQPRQPEEQVRQSVRALRPHLSRTP